MGKIVGSNFHENVHGKKLSYVFNDKSNKVSLFCHVENKSTGEDDYEESGIVQTDMIEDIDMFVRVILNVQLLKYGNIDELINKSRVAIQEFLNGIDPDNYEIDSDVDDIISTNGPIYKGKQISSWVYIDIPLVQKHISKVNETINKITSEYRNICKSQDIVDVEDVFSIVKFIARINVINKVDAYNMLLVSNYQKPNKYVPSSIIHINTPSGVDVDIKNIKSEASEVGCSLNLVNSDEPGVIDVVFDDRVRMTEVSVQRFVEKSDKLIIPHFSSRVISIYKKNKTKPLIKNENGVIEVGTIGMNIKEFPKTTGFINEYIGNFITSTNNKLPVKTVRAIAHVIGKIVTFKVIKFSESITAE